MPVELTSRPVPAGADDACATAHPAGTALDRIRRALVDGPVVEELTDTFKVLGDATRVRMLDALSQSDLCVCDLASILGLSESAVSHQLRLLRGLRIVRPRRAGRRIFYSLHDQHVISLFQQARRHVEESRATHNS